MQPLRVLQPLLITLIKQSAAEKVVTEQKRPSESRPQEHRIDNNYNTQPGHQIDGTFKTGTVSEAGKNASQPEKIDSVHGGSSTAKESLNAIKAKDYSGDNKSEATPVQPVVQGKKDIQNNQASGYRKRFVCLSRNECSRCGYCNHC